jgi:hypothetical protein
MASNAIGHLRDAALVSPDDGSTVRVSAVAENLRAAIEQLPGGVRDHRQPTGYPLDPDQRRRGPAVGILAGGGQQHQPRR